MSEHLLEIKDLEVQFHTMDSDVHAVNGIDLTIDAGRPSASSARPAQARRPPL